MATAATLEFDLDGTANKSKLGANAILGAILFCVFVIAIFARSIMFEPLKSAISNGPVFWS